MPRLRCSPDPGPALPSQPSQWAWTALHPSTGTALHPPGFPKSQGSIQGEPGGARTGWEVLALLSVAWGVRAPGWEFCFPLLCLDSRPAEIRDQQSKSNCSSSQALWPFSRGAFALGGSPCASWQSRDVQWDPRACCGVDSPLLNAPEGKDLGVKGERGFSRGTAA